MIGNAQRFWTQQEAFIAKVSSNPAQVRKRAAWDVGGRYRVKHTPQAQGPLTVETDLNRLAFNFIEQSFPKIAEAYNRHFAPVAQRAFAEWPKKTGLSKSLLTLDFAMGEGGSSFTGSIRSLAPYSFYIQDSKPGGAYPYRYLIFEPGAEAADAMADQIASELADG